MSVFTGLVQRKFFCSPFLGDRKKRCRTDKLSKIKASDLILLARRRTRVRRVAKFVRSIKHNFFINFRFSLFLRCSIGLLNLQNTLLYLVLYGLRFFYIPFFAIKQTAPTVRAERLILYCQSVIQNLFNRTFLSDVTVSILK